MLAAVLRPINPFLPCPENSIQEQKRPVKQQLIIAIILTKEKLFGVTKTVN
jgi:hypothetical protein